MRTLLPRKFFLLLFSIAVIFIFIITAVILNLLSNQSSPKNNFPGTTPTVTDESRKSTPTLTIQEAMEAQSEADRRYGDAWKQVREDYPWYDDLPLHTEQYFVYFDIEMKSFIAKLYPSPNTPEQVEVLQAQVLNGLISIDVDPDEYTIEWIVN